MTQTKKQKPKDRATPKTSYAVLIMAGTLQTDYAQKANKRYYKRVGGSLYQISVLGRKNGANVIKEEAIEDLEQQINDVMEGQLRDMQAAINGMKEKAGDRLSRVRIEYVSPQDVEFKMSTQLQEKYMDVIEKLDELVMCIDSMTLLRLKKTGEQVKESYSWRRQIESTSSEIVRVASDFTHRLNDLIARSNQKKQNKDVPAAGEMFEDKAPVPQGMNTTPIAVSA